MYYIYASNLSKKKAEIMSSFLIQKNIPFSVEIMSSRGKEPSRQEYADRFLSKRNAKILSSFLIRQNIPFCFGVESTRDNAKKCLRDRRRRRDSHLDTGAKLDMPLDDLVKVYGLEHLPSKDEKL